MHLYSYLDRLGERALYSDTDSVIFVQKDIDTPLRKCGDALGDMNNELKGNEDISEFVSWGPKNYAYKLRNSVIGSDDSVLIARYCTNYNASQLLNFEVIKDRFKRCT